MSNVTMPKYFDNIFSTTEYILKHDIVANELPRYLRSSDAIYLVASGRSYNIPLSVLRAYNEERASESSPVWKYVGGIETFPVGRPRDILKIQGLDSVLVLAISGSGNTKIVLESLKDIFDGGKKDSYKTVNYFFITGNIDGELYRIGSKINVPILLINSNTKETSNGDYNKGGLMGDIFELSSALLISSMLMDKSLHKIKEKVIDNIKRMEENNDTFVDDLIRNNTVLGGFGVGSHPSEAFATRLRHLSPYTNRNVSLIGPLAHLSYGDNLVLVTYSGVKNPFIKTWIDRANSRRANIYIITSGHGDIDKKYINTTIIPLESESKSEFYTLVNFYLNYIIFKNNRKTSRSWSKAR